MLEFLIAFVAAQSASLPDPPPEPDFITAVDYTAWFEKQFKGNCRDEDNAGPLYREILGDPPTLETIESKPDPHGGGPRWNVAAGAPGPWNPADHADWEAVYQRRRPFIELFRTAARRPYVCFSREAASNPDVRLCNRLSTDRRLRYFWSSWSACVSDHAWRAENGTPDVDLLIDLAGANLGLWRQLAQDASVLSLLRAIRVRSIAHEDLTTALELGLLSELQRARCLQLLQARDAAGPTLQAIARFELAEHYDSLQLEAHYELGSTSADIARGRFHLPFPVYAKLIASRDEARAFYQGLERLSAAVWTPRFDADVEELKRLSARAGSLGSIQSNAGPAKYVRLLTQAEAARRAMRLIFEIHVRRDEIGAWPASLSDLRGVPEESKTDPFFGKRFIYKPAGDSFQLYSVSIDGRDNGGVHDSRWGKKIPNSDYVFWPMPD